MKATSKKVKLNLGCGVHLIKGFINVDNYFSLDDLLEGIKTKKGPARNAIIDKGAQFVQADIRSLPFVDNCADLIEIHNTIEHIYFLDVFKTFKEMYRVLKKGGKLILSTNNFDGLVLDWIQMSINQRLDLTNYQNIHETIYGNQVGGEGETHKTAFNPNFLNYCLAQAGFKDGEIAILPKGSPVVDLGEIMKANPKMVYRNEMLFVKATK